MLEIVPLRCVRLVNKPFSVHYADTSSLCEYKKTIKQSIHTVLFVTQGGLTASRAYIAIMSVLFGGAT